MDLLVLVAPLLMAQAPNLQVGRPIAAVHQQLVQQGPEYTAAAVIQVKGGGIWRDARRMSTPTSNTHTFPHHHTHLPTPTSMHTYVHVSEHTLPTHAHVHALSLPCFLLTLTFGACIGLVVAPAHC